MGRGDLGCSGLSWAELSFKAARGPEVTGLTAPGFPVLKAVDSGPPPFIPRVQHVF